MIYAFWDKICVRATLFILRLVVVLTVSNGGGNASVGWAVGSEGVVVLIAWFTYEVVYFPDLF